MKFRDLFKIIANNMSRTKLRLINTTVSVTIVLTVSVLLISCVTNHRNYLEERIVNKASSGVSYTLSYDNPVINYRLVQNLKTVLSNQGFRPEVAEIKTTTKFADEAVNEIITANGYGQYFETVLYDVFDREIIKGARPSGAGSVAVTAEIFELLSGVYGLNLGDSFELLLTAGYRTVSIKGVLDSVIEGENEIYIPMSYIDEFSISSIALPSASVKYDADRLKEVRKTYNAVADALMRENIAFGTSMEDDFADAGRFDYIVIPVFTFLILLQLLLGVGNLLGSALITTMQYSAAFGLYRLLGLGKKHIFAVCFFEGALAWAVSSVLSLAVSLISYKPFVELAGRTVFFTEVYPPVFPSGEVVLLYVSVLSLLAVYLLLRMRKFSDVKLLALLRSEEL